MSVKNNYYSHSPQSGLPIPSGEKDANMNRFKALFAAGVGERRIKKELDLHPDDRDSIAAFEEARVWKREHRKEGVSKSFFEEAFGKGEISVTEKMMGSYIAAGGEWKTLAKHMKKRYSALSKEIDWATTPQDREQAQKSCTHFVEVISKIKGVVKEELITRSGEREESIPSKVLNFLSRERAHTAERNEEKVEKLFRKIVNKSGPSELLFSAASIGCCSLIEELLSSNLVNIDSRSSSHGSTALHFAAYYGNEDAIKLLLDKGADPGVVNNPRDEGEGGETPLHMACRMGHLGAAKLLLDAGAPSDNRAASGYTPIHYACWYDIPNSCEIAKLLIERKASLNAELLDGTTPLHIAVEKGKSALVKLLIEEGATLGVRNNDLKTPFDHALAKKSFNLIRDLFCNHIRVQTLITSNGTEEAIEKIRKTPELLLDSKGNFEKGSNPLEVPFLFDDKKLAKALKEKMPGEEFKRALQELKEKYPKQNLHLFSDCEVELDRSSLWKCSEKRELQPAAPIPFAKLEMVLGDVELFYSEKLLFNDSKSLIFRDDGTVWQRRATADGEGFEEVLYIKAEEMQKVAAEALSFDEEGVPLIDGKSYPFLFLRAGERAVRAEVRAGEQQEMTLLPAVSLLHPLFDRINFSDKEGPGYRDPSQNKDTSANEREEEKVVSVNELQEGIDFSCMVVNCRIPYLGTPSASEPDKLNRWYDDLERDLQKIVGEAFENPCADDKDPTPWALNVIEIGIAGRQCGTRLAGEVKSMATLSSGGGKTVEEQVFTLISMMKNTLVESFIDTDYDQNTHEKSKLLQAIDIYCGIPESEKGSRYHFIEPFVNQEVDEEGLIAAFERRFEVSQIVDAIDRAVNKENLLETDLLVDWFKENVPQDFQEKYVEILKELETIEGRENKIEYLQDKGIIYDPSILEEKPDWKKIVDEEMRSDYVLYVWSGEAGNFEREALIHILKTFGILN